MCRSCRPPAKAKLATGNVNPGNADNPDPNERYTTVYEYKTLTPTIANFAQFSLLLMSSRLFSFRRII